MNLLMSGSGGGDLGNFAGMKGAAGMELLKKDFYANPSRRSDVIRQNAQVALDAFAEPTPTPYVNYFTRYLSWGKAPRSVIHLGFGMAYALDQMSVGETAGAEAMLASLLAALELSCLDSGRWEMPWLITHLPDVPWHLLSVTPTPTGVRPYGRLAPVQLSVVAMQMVKEAASFEELRRKQAGPYGGSYGNEDGPGKGAGKGFNRNKAPPPKAGG